MANNLPDFNLWLAGQQAANKYGVDPDMVHAIIKQESGYNPNAVSPRGATGLMQLMPGTAKDLGVDPRDPLQNIDGGVRYLAQLSKQFGGDSEKVRAAYNFGPGHVARGDALPSETVDYLKKTAPAAQADLPNFMEWMKTQQDAAPPEEKSIGGFLNNVATSGGHLLEGIARTGVDVVGSTLQGKVPETVKSLGKLALGTVQEAAPSLGRETFGDQRPTAEAVGRFYKDRITHPIDTLYNDPVGAAADLAAVLGVGGALPGKIGEVASAASDLVNPLNVVAKPMRAASESAYGAALGTTRTMRKQAGMTMREFGKQGLADAANITDGGAEKLQRLSEADMAARNATIDRATQAGQMVKPQDIVQPLGDLRAKMAMDANPAGKVAQVDQAVQEFLDKFRGQTSTGLPAMRKVPLDELEKIKETTYKYTPNNAWVSDAVPPALREARMALGSSMKGQIEAGTQGFENGTGSVKDLNRSYAQRQALKDAIVAQGDAPGGGLRHMIEVFGLAGAGHPIEGMLLRLMDNPKVISMLAQAGYHAPTAARATIAPVALMNALNGAGSTTP